MKCRGLEELQNQRTEQVTKMYGTKALEAMQSEAALLLLDNFPWFRRAGLKTYFDAQAGNCSRELNDNAADRIFIKDRRGRHEADEIMRFEEVVNDAEHMLSRKMDFGGIEPEPVWERAEAKVPDKVFLGTDRNHRSFALRANFRSWPAANLQADARIAWYAYLGRRAVRVWIASGTLALLDMKYPSGRRRFPIVKVERDFTFPLADFMSGWIERFIGGQDRDRTAEQHGRLRRLRDEYGVDLTPVSEQEREEDETGKIGTVSKPFRADPPKPIREAPEAFRKIMEDVRNGRGVGIFPGKR